MAQFADAPALDPVMQAIRDLPTVTASALKSHFGEVSSKAMKGALAITRHSRPEFVLVPIEQYIAFQRNQAAPMEALSAEFDAMVARMNSPKAQQGVAKLFQATPTQLGRTAMKSARPTRG